MDYKNSLQSLNELVEQNFISLETIQIASHISQKELFNAINGDQQNLSLQDQLFLWRLGTALQIGLPSASDDERLKGIIECLVGIYKFEIVQLSRLLSVSENAINNILEDIPIGLNDRYQLAIRASYLFYALKREE